MKFSYIEKSFKGVIAAAIALGVVASVSTYASGPAETPTAQTR